MKSISTRLFIEEMMRPYFISTVPAVVVVVGTNVDGFLESLGVMFM